MRERNRARERKGQREREKRVFAADKESVPHASSSRTPTDGIAGVVGTPLRHAGLRKTELGNEHVQICKRVQKTQPVSHPQLGFPKTRHVTHLTGRSSLQRTQSPPKETTALNYSRPAIRNGTHNVATIVLMYTRTPQTQTTSLSTIQNTCASASWCHTRQR